MNWLSDFIKKKVDEGLQNISSGYGNWINGVVENVQSGIQQGIDYVKNSLGTSSGQDTTTPPATTPTTTPTSTPTPPETTPTQTTPTTTPETPSVTTPQATAPVTTPPASTPTPPETTPTQTTPTTTPETPSVTTPPSTAPVTTPQTSTPQTSTPTTTEPTTTPESTPPESTPPTSTPEVATGFDTYQDFLGNNMQNIDNIYTNTVTTLDKQNGETLQQIDETLEKGKEYATDVKETTDKALEDQKAEVYKYIEDTLADTLGYNNEAYGKLVEDITGAMEAGKLQAEEAKKLLMLIADEAKNATYGAAERQREEAERQADINRQRAIADANSAYEQNKAGYGANAEALANMGLSGGGYSDWINASAYAQNRSEVQGARAQSDAAKREAKYTEDQTKLQADREYTDKKYQAESDYLYKMGEIDTTYRTNMTEAEQKKLKADQDAKDTARDLKLQADSDYAAGKLKSETEYKGFLYDIETEADKNRLETNQKTELGKLEASNDYITAIMQNEGELAKFKEALKAEDKQAQQVQLSMYEKVLKGVSDGTYTAEDAAALANAFEFSQEWKDEIANAAGRKEETDAGIKAEQDQQQRVQNFGTLLEKGKTGELTADEIMAFASELGFDVNNPDDKKLLDLAVKAADGYAAASDEEKQYQKSMNALTVLEDVKKGTYTADEIPQIAAMLGLDPEKDKGIISMLTNAATDFANGVTKTEDQQRTSNLVELIGIANSGELTKDELKYLAGKLGLSEEDIKLLESAADRYENKKALEEEFLEKGTSSENKSTILEKMADGSIGLDITDSDIDKWVKEDILTSEDAEELKTERNEMITEELEYYAQNGYTTEAIDKVEKLVEKGIINEDDDLYQKTYFDVGLYDAKNLVNTGSATVESIVKYKNTLDKQKEEGKISAEDYDSLMNYVYSGSAQILPKDSYDVSTYTEFFDSFEKIKGTINGETYSNIWLDSSKKADKTLTSLLDNMTSNGENIVMFDNELYVKTEKYGWCPVNKDQGKDFIEAYAKAYETQPNVSAPKHKVKTSTGTNSDSPSKQTSVAVISGGSSGGKDAIHRVNGVN